MTEPLRRPGVYNRRLDHSHRIDMRAGYYSKPFVPNCYRVIDGLRGRVIETGDADRFLVEIEYPKGVRSTTVVSAARFLTEWRTL